LSGADLVMEIIEEHKAEVDRGFAAKTRSRDAIACWNAVIAAGNWRCCW
jgi:hypothetical protein